MNRNILTVIAGVVIVVVLLVASVFVYSVENPSVAKRRVTQILETPNTFYGSTVHIEGEVENVLGTQALTVDSAGAIGEQLLVISRDSLEPVGGSGIPTSIFNPADTVSVEGEVHEFDLSRVERELGIDLDNEQFAAWQGRPYVYADDITLEDK